MHAALAYQASPLPCPACVSLQTFMQRRRAVLLSDSYWAEAIPRIDIYIWIMQVRACSLCLQPAACGLWLAAIAGGAEQAQPAGTALVPAFNLKRKTSCCCALFLGLQLGGWQLDRPLELGWSRCRPDNAKGPCAPQAPGVLSLGGIIYGNFNL
jgi:hypothetical protein